MNKIIIPAPAKTNLTLHIQKKRSDGFHGLISLFQRISLCDDISLSKNDSKKLNFKVSNKKLSQIKENLIEKAYRLLSQEVGFSPGLTVFLKKRIPMGAGLGGGSSDVASFLMGVNQLYSLNLTRSRLCRLGARIGSDVPFFLYDTPLALVEGRGERVRPLGVKLDLVYLIVSFRKSFSTKEMYHLFDLKLQQPLSLTKVRADAKICLSLLYRRELCKATPYLINDFNSIAEDKFARISQLYCRWRGKKIPHFLSGSGSSVVAAFESNRAAASEQRLLREVGYRDTTICEPYSFSLNTYLKEELSREDN